HRDRRRAVGRCAASPRGGPAPQRRPGAGAAAVPPVARGPAGAGRRRAARLRPADRREESEGPAAQSQGRVHSGDPMRAIAPALPLATWPALAHEVEVPVLFRESPEAEPGEVDTELNLATLVQTAAKGVPPVQEAPAIITIIPADEIVDRGARDLSDVIDRVPGWIRYGAEFNQFPSLNPRGECQATLLLRDGVS